MTQLLAYDNDIRLRRRGLQLLLYFMNVLNDKVDFNMYDVLRRAIDFTPLCGNVSQRVALFFEELLLTST